jgi:hypothetical protein
MCDRYDHKGACGEKGIYYVPRTRLFPIVIKNFSGFKTT